MLVVTHGSFPPSGLCRNYHFSRELLLSHSFYFCCCTCIVKRPARKVTTDASGEAIFDKLPLYDEQGNAITYTLTESSTPDDYIQLDEEINVSFTATDRPEDGIYWETTDGKYLLHEVEYEVVNGQYFPVVHTGGSGFYWPGVLGAGAAAAGVLYLIRRKTKGHNTER